MPLDRHAAEACREAVHELAGQRDLRQHDERLAALLQRACHRLEVDLGLAGAGDAVEQCDGEGRRRLPRAWRARRAPAHRRIRPSCAPDPGRPKRFSGIATSTRLPASIRPSITPVVQPASAASALLARIRPSAAISSARLRAGVMRGGSAAPSFSADAEAGLHRLEHRRRAHHHAHHHAELRERVACDPFGEPQRNGRERRHLRQGGGDGLELLLGTGLPASPTAVSHTTPMRLCGPKGTSTKLPGAASISSGRR